MVILSVMFEMFEAVEALLCLIQVKSACIIHCICLCFRSVVTLPHRGLGTSF